MLKQMLNKYANFGFFTMKKLLLALDHENLVNITRIGINIHECQSNPRNGHLCTKVSSFLIAIVSHCR